MVENYDELHAALSRVEFLQPRFRHPHVSHTVSARGQTKLVDAVKKFYMAPTEQYLEEKAREERNYPNKCVGMAALHRAAAVEHNRSMYVFLGDKPFTPDPTFMQPSDEAWEPLLRVARKVLQDSGL